MQELIKGLQEAGLSHIEAEVYMTSLLDGPSPVGKIARRTRQYRPNVYQAIDRLKAKGLLSEQQGKRGKLYQGLSPDHLLETFERKRSIVQQTATQLKTMKQSTTATTSLRVIEGVNGWRNLLNEFLDIGAERVVYGVPKKAIELSGDFFERYHKKRAQRKLPLRHLYNFEAKDRLRITNKLPYTKSKYLPKELNQPVSTSICGPLVAITTYHGNEIVTVVIENETIAAAYRSYFEFLWKVGKE